VITVNKRFPPITFLIVAFLIASLPFLGKAYHIDDPLFLWSAKQILSNPIDFYGFTVNWYGQEMPAYLVNKNPPLTSYYMAAVAYPFGWKEWSIHCGLLLPAIAFVLGAYRLARYFCSSPLLAASFASITPLFMVSSTTAMCDVMMLSLWVWALVFWIGGTVRIKKSALYLASFMAVLCSLTKYGGIFLFPLFFIFALSHQRKLGAWLLPLFMGAFLLWGYEQTTRNLYGVGLLSDAVLYSSTIKNSLSKSDIDNLIMGLSFLGGCLINTALLSPYLWKRRTIAAGAAGAVLLAVLLPLFKSLGGHLLIDANGVKWSLVIHLSLFVATGISFIALAIMDFWNKRDEYGLLLFAWIIGIFTFGAFLNWTINARSFLSLAPAAGMVLARRLDALSKKTEESGPSSWLRIHPLLWVLMVLAALSVSWGDLRLANTARDAAHRLFAQYGGDGRTLWFQGHWGFQYYMQEAGARAWDMKHSTMEPQDFIVIPSNNTNVYKMHNQRISLVEIIKLNPSLWLATMSPVLGAGFYWDGNGPLPFAIGSVPPEEYGVFVLESILE
jgi:4-amino-4-deoxy-L-arabinose transferase-like glycosyltransferase